MSPSSLVEVPSTADIIAGEARYLVQTYTRPPRVFTHGEGAYLFDSTGNRLHPLRIRMPERVDRNACGKIQIAIAGGIEQIRRFTVSENAWRPGVSLHQIARLTRNNVGSTGLFNQVRGGHITNEFQSFSLNYRARAAFQTRKVNNADAN